MITLFDYQLSGNCYKPRLLMGMLGLQWQTRAVDFHPGREHRSAWFLALNPLGELPVLQDDGLVLRDAQAILVYLASRYDPGGTWYPRADPAALARIAMWLAFANRITATAGAARMHESFQYPLDAAAARAGAHALFRVLDEHLWFGEQRGENWLCGEGPTIADIACFPYVMLSEEGGVSRLPYPAIGRWTDRFRRLPGFAVMPGIFPVDE